MAENTTDQIIRKLRSGKLPQMVDWLDPRLLVRIAIRDIISGTIGQYADQRLMQAASERDVSEAELVGRYDYSREDSAASDKRLSRDENGAVWVDYVADLGDGFEATYAMAYLMAAERLAVRTSHDATQSKVALPPGEILIMGGDQAYPQATVEEYQQRLILPYKLAFNVAEPSRKLFAIPGNHDWYDGSGAFTGLFTAARSRITQGIGREIGGWRSMQHRSYFAVKLLHDWWIWAPDIQLAGNLDDPQRDYFDLVADYTKECDKIVLCLAEPSWHHQNYDNLHAISLIARKHGAKICAILAGDWHHYSRYFNPDLGIQFVTCGGGGSFAHATHQLKKSVTLHWATGTEGAGAETPSSHGSSTGSRQGSRTPDEATPEMSNTTVAAAAHSVADIERRSVAAQELSPSAMTTPNETDRFSRFKSKFRKTSRHIDPKSVKYMQFRCDALTIYPSRTRSRLLSLKNLAMPFRNRSFALFVGTVYFIYSWVFQTSAPALDTSLIQLPVHAPNTPSDATAAIVKIGEIFWGTIAPSRVFDAARTNPAFFFMLLGLWAGLVYYVDLGAGVLNALGRFAIGTAHFLAHLWTLLVVNLLIFVPSFMLAGLSTVLLSTIGVAGASSLLFESAASMAVYCALSIIFGGLLGAFVMGVYWTLTCSLFNMHCGDAFGALGIRNYKHFLRLKFEPERLTIYPIAVDKVPGRKGWRKAREAESGGQNAQIVPVDPLNPFLIEDPIVVEASSVSSKLQRVE